jgi:hypothetical protein
MEKLDNTDSIIENKDYISFKPSEKLRLKQTNGYFTKGVLVKYPENEDLDELSQNLIKVYFKNRQKYFLDKDGNIKGSESCESSVILTKREADENLRENPGSIENTHIEWKMKEGILVYFRGDEPF